MIDGSRPCAARGCHKQIPASAHANKKYHSKRCRDRENKRKYRERQRTSLLEPSKLVRGNVYETLKDNPKIIGLLENGELSQSDVARAIGVGTSQFSKEYATYLMDAAVIEAAETWVMDPEVERWLAVGDHGPPRDDDDNLILGDGFEEWLTAAVEAFADWRAANFIAPNGKPYITKLFHKVWIKQILRAILTGGRHMILSPPRHGKSELLIHFVVWMICRDPHFRAIWIGPNEDIAKDMVGHVKSILEENTKLREAVLPPDQTWAPKGRIKTTWGVTKLTVANRSYVLKAPTLRAVGRGQKILSMDVDLIICDDIEDFDSTLNEGSREGTRNWMFNNVESRKEEHTAWLVIGSRQHPDDVYDYILVDDQWTTQVDSAHNEACGKDPYDLDIHVDCMLFPELRTYVWLEGKRRSAENQGLLANFEMVYLNDPRPEGMVVFSEDAIEKSKNYKRGLGLEGIREDVRRRTGKDEGHLVSYHLVGGLDPSATGYQAAFLWAWVGELNRLYAVDLDNRKGGGIYEFLKMIIEWDDTFELKHWLWENNILSETDLKQNPDVRETTETRGIYLEPHNTQGGNKNDPLFGVGAMSKMFEDGMIDLPWGTEAARQKMHVYIRQMIRFVDSGTTLRRTNRKTDILMSSWFPMKAIRRFQKERIATVDTTDDAFEMEGWEEALAESWDDLL